MKIAGVSNAVNDGGNSWTISIVGNGDLRKEIAEMAMQQSIAVISMSKKELKLEEIFKELTTANSQN
jgi:hypothetical protein